MEDINVYSELYDKYFVNESFAKRTYPEDLIRKVKEEADSKGRAEIKIVINGKFYDVNDVYTIDEDKTNVSYICIEAKDK